MMLFGRLNLWMISSKSFLCSSGDERFILNPLGELINGDVYVPETTRRWLKRANHVQSPACKGPGSWNGLQLLCQHVYLLGKKLTSFIVSYKVFGIGDGCGLVETRLESLADQCSRGRVVAAGTRLNFEK